MQARFAQIRKDGIAVSQGELDEQVLGVAAPIHDVKGAILAAVSVAALASRISRAELRGVQLAVKDAASRISEQLAAIDLIA